MEFIDLAKLIGEECGKVLEEGFYKVKEISQKTGPADIVTDWDRKSEKTAFDILKKYRPKDGMLGEEGSDYSGETGYKWIIDPLDGTLNFAYGVPLFAVSVAFCKDGKPLCGAVYDPIHKEMFWAEKGRGAFLGDRQIFSEDTDKIENSLLYLSWMPSADRAEEFRNKTVNLYTKVPHLRRMGSAALGLAYVACGRISGFVEAGLHPWDVAAGILIAEEAGAVACDRYGRECCMENRIVDVISAPPNIHKQIMNELK